MIELRPGFCRFITFAYYISRSRWGYAPPIADSVPGVALVACITGCGISAGQGGWVTWQHHQESGHIAVHHRSYSEPATYDIATDPTPAYDTCPSWPSPAARANSWISGFSPTATAGSRSRHTTDLSREELFDVLTEPAATRDHPLISTRRAGWTYRITNYHDDDHSNIDSPFGVHVHHPRFLEWVGAPELARLLSRPPAEWLQFMNHRDTMYAALQLQRDASLMSCMGSRYIRYRRNQPATGLVKELYVRRNSRHVRT